MKNFYMVVTVELDKNENIFSDEKKEPSMGLYSYVITANTSENLLSSFGCIRGLKSANIFETKTKAVQIADYWNECFKKNGTYLYSK